MIPVVCAVPEWAQRLRGVERVHDLRRRAAQAVERSAELMGMRGFEAHSDGEGRPRVFQGMHWSRAHSRRWVAGVVAPNPVGIDVEGPRLLGSGAQALVWGTGDPLARWVAMEAALKCFGLGLRAASRLRVEGALARLSGLDLPPAQVWFRSQPPLWLGLAWQGAPTPVRWTLWEGEV